MRSRSSALHREQHHNGSAAIRDSSHGCLSQKNATECPRSGEGQKRRFDRVPFTSGLASDADIVTAGRHVAKVPKAEVAARPDAFALRLSRPNASI
jgi:hypothetical protein